MKSKSIIPIIIYAIFATTMVVGEVKCITKAIDCNWQPIGKAEIIYTGASMTGLGVFVGYMNIEDK